MAKGNTNNDDDDKPIDDVGTKPRPVTDELRARVVALHGDGLGRNAIAREVEVSGATVSKIAHQLGLSFDREATAFALRARQIDLGVIRERLARKMLVRAEEALDDMDAPVTIGQFGGSDNVWNERVLEQPTIEARSILMRTATAAAAKGIDLLKVDALTGSAAARGILGGLQGALETAVEAMDAAGMLPDPTVTPEQQG